MAATIQPTTKLKIAAEPDVPSAREPKPLSIDSSQPGLEWSLGRAWRLRMLWGPVAQAAEAVVADSCAGMEGQFTFRVLVIGRHTAALSGMLTHAAARKLQFEVRALEPDGEPSLPFEAGAFDCAIALDWLPLIRSSQRESAVAELCRIARLGVLIANPFHTPEVAAAERAVNALHLAATGKDNPDLGRHLEYGLPELDLARRWFGAAFAHVTTEPMEALATWRVFASVAVQDSDGEITAEDAAVAALLPLIDRAIQPPAYRTLVVGSSSPLALVTAPRGQSGDFGALATHLAIEAAAQRRALDRLTEAVTSERTREGDQFRATVASLAAELHEREAHAGMLGADLNERECVVADQTAVIEALERRLSETDVHLRNLECERDATSVHVRNLEYEREATSVHLRNLESEREATSVHLRNLENERDATNAHVRNLENERDATNTHVRNLENERESRNTHISNLEIEREATAVHVCNLEYERERAVIHIRELESELNAASAHSQDLVDDLKLPSYASIKRKMKAMLLGKE